MPRRTLRLCTSLNCYAKHRNGNGFCNDHQQQPSGWERSRKGLSRHERGYGSDWDKLREQILIRDDYLCQIHLEKGMGVPATDVDHIVNKAQGGTDDEDNLQSLCGPCHKEKTHAERDGGGSKV